MTGSTDRTASHGLVATNYNWRMRPWGAHVSPTCQEHAARRSLGRWQGDPAEAQALHQHPASLLHHPVPLGAGRAGQGRLRESWGQNQGGGPLWSQPKCRASSWVLGGERWGSEGYMAEGSSGRGGCCPQASSNPGRGTLSPGKAGGAGANPTPRLLISSCSGQVTGDSSDSGLPAL